MRADGERQASRSDRESSLVKILADASGFERARAHESAYSTNKRTVANGFDGFSICNFPRSAQKRKKEGKKQEKAEGTFPPFIPASDLTNEAIARLKRREPSLSHFDVSSALKLRMIKKEVKK